MATACLVTLSGFLETSGKGRGDDQVKVVVIRISSGIPPTKSVPSPQRPI